MLFPHLGEEGMRDIPIQIPPKSKIHFSHLWEGTQNNKISFYTTTGGGQPHIYYEQKVHREPTHQFEWPTNPSADVLDVWFRFEQWVGWRHDFVNVEWTIDGTPEHGLRGFLIDDGKNRCGAFTISIVPF
jgi:hypothetical protein